MLLAVLGAVGIVVGILAIVWPGITVWVLALLIGIRLLIWGVLQLAIAFQMRSLTQLSVRPVLRSRRRARR